MPSDIMTNARAVRREDLLQEEKSLGDGPYATKNGEEDGEAAAARAALVAYMEETLGLQSALASQQPAPPKPAPPKAATEPDTENFDVAESMDSSDDDRDGEANGAKKPLPEKSQSVTEFAFRMFSGSGKAAVKATNSGATEPAASPSAPGPIVFLDDGDGTEALGPGGIVNPPRPLEFYLAGKPSPEELAQYARITLTGEDIQAVSRTRTWGWEVPWRVRTVLRAERKASMRALVAHALSSEDAAALSTDLEQLLASAANAVPTWASSTSPEPTPLPLYRQPLSAQTTIEEATRKRCRPGKQYRIKLRKRAQARQEKVAKAAAQKQSKEEHLLEKKKRLNRSKKLRRREKKRQAKGEDGEEGGASENGSEDE
ncbi:MAG: hypothetical protein SEPTF4163_003799 [Sporothrix epigloea]